jgi:hypothetical protein
MPNPRRALRLEEWPERDRTDWYIAIRAGDILDEARSCGVVAPSYERDVTTGYGLWLASLGDRNDLKDVCSPGERTNKERLGVYLQHVRSLPLSSVTMTKRFVTLREALRVMDSGADLTYINRIIQALKAQQRPIRDKRQKLVSPRVLLENALNELRRLDRDQQRHPSRRTAERFRDALSIAFLTTRPLRLKNLTEIENGRYLTKEAGTRAGSVLPR